MERKFGGRRERVLGTVTIGQSPRPDLIPELTKVMGSDASADVRIVEAGALDGLTLNEVGAMGPQAGDYVLVTRMADGTAVKIAERCILPRMQAQIEQLVRRGASVIALVCTGEFPRFSCERLLVEPQKVLYHAVSALVSGRTLGVLLPDEDQVAQGIVRWSSVWGPESAIEDVGQRLRIEAASPYGDLTSIEEAAVRLREWGAELIVMDCIGYTLDMKDRVRDLTGVPVILARSILGRTIAEVL